MAPLHLKIWLCNMKKSWNWNLLTGRVFIHRFIFDPSVWCATSSKVNFSCSINTSPVFIQSSSVMARIIRRHQYQFPNIWRGEVTGHLEQSADWRQRGEQKSPFPNLHEVYFCYTQLLIIGYYFFKCQNFKPRVWGLSNVKYWKHPPMMIQGEWNFNVQTDLVGIL